MKNFPFEHEGKTLWYSRSMACTIYVFARDMKTHMWYVLMNKRGPGCPTNIGKWNVPGGYLDFDEDLRSCALRETFEETGLVIDKDAIELIYIESNPKINKSQNVIFSFCVNLGRVKDIRNIKITDEHCEPNEVSDIQWVPVKVFCDCTYNHPLSYVINHTAYGQDHKIANIFTKHIKPSIWRFFRNG